MNKTPDWNAIRRFYAERIHAILSEPSDQWGMYPDTGRVVLKPCAARVLMREICARHDVSAKHRRG